MGAWAPSMQRSRYDEAIATLRGCIKSGDAYQVNLTLRLRAGWERRGGGCNGNRTARPHGHC